MEASRSVDIGMLDKESLRELIRKPLADRNIEVDEDVVNAVLRLSSGAPHDANILMYYAFESARKEETWWQGVRRIKLHHLLPGGRPGSGEWLGALLNKYANRQQFLLKKLDDTERNLVRGYAGDGLRPSMQHPDPSEWATAEWEKVKFGIPTYEHDSNEMKQNRYRWRNVFADGGYRARLQTGETTDLGITAAAGQELYALWIPWGLAEYIRTSVRNEEVGR
jgi:hypothetical protein